MKPYSALKVVTSVLWESNITRLGHLSDVRNAHLLCHGYRPPLIIKDLGRGWYTCGPSKIMQALGIH